MARCVTFCGRSVDFLGFMARCPLVWPCYPGSRAPHPDGAVRGTILELQAIEAAPGPEPDGSCIRTIDADMRGRDPGAGHPLREQHRSSATSLSSLQQVQMEMRWIELDNLLRGTPRAMDSVRAALVRGPFGRRRRSRIGVLSAKFWPPFSLKPLLPRRGVRRTDGEPRTALVILDDKGQPRFEKRIRRGIDVTDQLAIFV